jgi:hypothetical protein
MLFDVKSRPLENRIHTHQVLIDVCILFFSFLSQPTLPPPLMYNKVALASAKDACEML